MTEDTTPDNIIAMRGPTEVHSGHLRFAKRLARAKWGRLLHVAGLGWYHWDGRRWIEDRNDKTVWRAIENLLAEAWAEVGRTTDDTAKKALIADIKRCESSGGTAGIAMWASKLRPLSAEVDDLDADPYLLNCANGTLDLRTMELRPHDPADHCTKVTTGAYYADTTGPVWSKFLTEVLPDIQVRDYLQRYLGVALVGTVLQHLLAIATGTGRNGKSVMYEAAVHAMGDYAGTAEPEIFMQRDGARHPAGEMELRGKRLVVVSESDKGRKLADATVKRLTGGDPITARKMHRDFVTFRPSHSALFITNHLPVVPGDDNALWARLRVIPFDVVIAAEDQDTHLGETLQLEADAILSWLVAGWADYVTRGEQLADPEAVRVATSAYRGVSDPIGRWIDERCLLGPNLRLSTADAYADWSVWSEAEGVDEVEMRAFGRELGSRGFLPKKGAQGVRLRVGLGLQS